MATNVRRTPVIVATVAITAALLLLAPMGRAEIGSLLTLALGTVIVSGLILLLGTLVLQHTVNAHDARAAALEEALFELKTASRIDRERLHEVRSIVAGLTSASQLVASGELPDEVSDRLRRTIDSELARLDRVVSPQVVGDATSSHVDLDEVLESIVQLHRARGRGFEWEPSGAQVLACTDAVAEAVNILLENAATHGSETGNRVAVAADPLAEFVEITVSDQGPGIPEDLRSEVFNWGTSRPDSPGQGIGLNVAQRLVSEQGGTITLDQPEASGSTFVIRLPAARTSPENQRVDA